MISLFYLQLKPFFFRKQARAVVKGCSPEMISRTFKDGWMAGSIHPSIHPSRLHPSIHPSLKVLDIIYGEQPFTTAHAHKISWPPGYNIKYVPCNCMFANILHVCISSLSDETRVYPKRLLFRKWKKHPNFKAVERSVVILGTSSLNVVVILPVWWYSSHFTKIEFKWTYVHILQ